MMEKRYRVALPALAVAASLVAAGCGSSGGSKPKVASKPAMPESHAGGMMSAETGAQVSVRAPSTGAVVTGNSVPTDVDISHFRVDCRFAGTPNKMGVGHYHIELDGSLINMFCKPRAAVSMLDVKPGKHVLSFIPAENEHEDDMKATQKTSFVYKPSRPLAVPKAESHGKPSIRIVAPKPGSTVHTGFDLTVAPKNFEFSCALYGKPNIAGYGHWHANVDSTSKGMMGMGTMLGMSCQRTFHVSLAGISPGPHTFFAILEDDQHAPTPKAQDSVRLNVR
jgi:hypothetical protein